jgi:hypothetical protein
VKKTGAVPSFSKTLLLNGKSIRQEKDRGKEKSRAEGKGVEVVFFSIQKGRRWEKWWLSLV